mmetsp:Transcript_12917/g.37129  ORF Transcript_12917/g.37129 Transcript_12917/m.37129 type:complete len:148 (-) Transcript_12917:186-629(-)
MPLLRSVLNAFSNMGSLSSLLSHSPSYTVFLCTSFTEFLFQGIFGFLGDTNEFRGTELSFDFHELSSLSVVSNWLFLKFALFDTAAMFGLLLPGTEEWSFPVLAGSSSILLWESLRSKKLVIVSCLWVVADTLFLVLSTEWLVLVVR